MMDDLFSQENGMFDILSSNEINTDYKKDKDNFTSSINAAAYLEKPEAPRGESNFVGLINQGGTCYMNSSLFVLYMNPILRQIIYDLPLCDNNDIYTPSNFVTDLTMYKILISLQKLFGSLQYLNVHSTSTKELTEAFGWNNSDTRDQHDNQEFIRQFFECLDDVLHSTVFNGVINNLYRVISMNYLTCTACKYTKSFQDFCLDINVPVQGFEGLAQSLDIIYNNYDIINDYHCSNCNKRVDLKKENKICQLPIFLTFFLNRLSYDMYTGDRIKIGSRFEFPLEINMGKYMIEKEDKNTSLDCDENVYELYAVVVHNGNPHRGHYFAYIRDFNEEGNWNLDDLKKFKNDPSDDSKESTENKEKVNDEKVINDTSEEIDKTTPLNSINNTKEINNRKKNSQRNESFKENDKNSNTPNKSNKSNNKPHNKSKNTDNNPKQMQVKSKGENDENYKRLNFDECDHPIEYANKSLSKRWFEFNDTSIYPIRVGRLRKQFQSSECAYTLFYMKKSVQANKCEAPEYLKQYFFNLNQELEIKRKDYEEEQRSLDVTILDYYQNFFIDEFKILSVKDDVNVNLEKTNSEHKKLNLKLKFYYKLEYLLNEIKKHYDLLEIEDVILYEIVLNHNSNNIFVLSKLDSSQKESTLEDLKICHNSKFICVLKSRTSDYSGVESESCRFSSIEKENNLTQIIDSQIGLEPISVHIICGAFDKTVRIFAHSTLEEFKKFLKAYFNLNYEISLVYKNNNKILNLDDIAFNKKTETWNSMKNLLHNKNILFVTKCINIESSSNSYDENILDNQIEEEISCIVRIEDNKEIQVINIRLNQTFAELLEKIKNELNLAPYLEVNENHLEKFSFRVRKDYDGKLIFKNIYSKKINSDETFLDGGVRLKFEFGEPYETNEILLKIYMIIDNEKVVKDFIGDPEKILLSDLKKFICDEFDFKFEDYMFCSTNAFCDPVKALKVENQTLKKLGLKDCDSIFLKNITGEQSETFYLKIYKPFVGENLLSDSSFVYKPITEDLLVNEFVVSKDSTLSQIKTSLIKNLNFSSISSADFLRLRVLNKRMDPEKILSGNDTSIKKFNLENRINLMLEVLPKEECLRKNQIQIFLWRRDVKDKSYKDKISVLFEFENTATSDQLYQLCRVSYNLKHISIAKYSKHNYIWEFIPEMCENGPINLRKIHGLKDGDWIGVREEKENEFGEDDFQTMEDRKILHELKNSKIFEIKENTRKTRTVEKPLRIPKFS